MKLVINIPKRVYDYILKKGTIVNSDRLEVAESIINGTKPKTDVLDKIRDEIEHKAHSGQWSDATMYGMLKAVAIIDKYKAESEG